MESTTWTASQAEARRLGGDLVTIDDLDENNWVYDTFTPLVADAGGLWIGLNDVANEGAFEWVSGEPVTFTNWTASEPNNSGPQGAENFAHIVTKPFLNFVLGEWNDVADNAAMRYGVVEVPGFIQNGSFETPDVSPGRLFGFGDSIGGWNVVSGNTAFLIDQVTNTGEPVDGNQFIEIHGDTIQQTVTGLKVGQRYKLTYYATARTLPDYFGSGSIIATIGGETDHYDYFLPSGSYLYNSPVSPWARRDVEFIAADTTASLTFSGTAAGPLGAIDAVRITAVPEPSTAAIFLLGGMLGMAIRPKRNASAITRPLVK
ncbi:lectin-like protein [Roseiconus nitratireducens]|uniref:lectin-like protein n=1 Tax=Roseiconus nitratireducens TaxID=2605748 RepID=UPI0013761A46|nr:lectin-like protein [Roseiconus nitratireducens]